MREERIDNLNYRSIIQSTKHAHTAHMGHPGLIQNPHCSLTPPPPLKGPDIPVGPTYPTQPHRQMSMNTPQLTQPSHTDASYLPNPATQTNVQEHTPSMSVQPTYPTQPYRQMSRNTPQLTQPSHTDKCPGTYPLYVGPTYPTQPQRQMSRNSHTDKCLGTHPNLPNLASYLPNPATQTNVQEHTP